MKVKTGRFLAAAGAALLALASQCALAQNWPTKAVRVINGFPTGGNLDLIARVVGERLTEYWGQPVLVEPKTGAGGNIGMIYASKQPADGYTLAVMPGGNAVVNPLIYENLGYETLQDFAPITLLARVDSALIVNPDTPIRAVPDLIALAKKQPGKLMFSTPGVGSYNHIAGELLKSVAGIDLRHVPYKGTPDAMNGVISGTVTMSFAQVTVAKPLIESGRIRALGVASLQRSSVLPDVPTIAEQGLPGFEMVSFYGLMAPAATPKDLVAKIARDVNRALKEPKVIERLQALGARPAGGTPEELTALIRSETARLKPIVKAANIRR